MNSSVRSIAAVVAFACAAVHGCRGDDDDAERPPQPQTFEFDFQSGMDGWQALFTHYPAGATPAEQASIDAFYELSSRGTPLPAPLDRTNGAIELTGNNHSDALQMLLKRRVTGLTPNTNYTLDLTLTIASDVPKNCLGIGGSPGESVVINASASTAEPMRAAVDGLFLHTLDLHELGNFANSRDCEDGIFEYELKTLSSINTRPLVVHTSGDGSVWIVIGTRSGFEGLTRAYIDHVTVTAQPDSCPPGFVCLALTP